MGAVNLSWHRDRWTVRYVDAKGRKRRVTVPGDPPRVLTEAERRVILEAARAKLLGEQTGDTLEAFVRSQEKAMRLRYARAEQRIAALYRLARALGERPLRSVTPLEAEDLLMGLGAGRRTVRLYAAYLRAIWTEAVRRGLADINPFEGLRLPVPDERVVPAFTEDEVARLLAACSEPYRSFFAFIYETGLRKGEALRVVREDVRDGRLTVRKTKTRRARVVPLSQRAREILDGLRPLRGIGRPNRVFAGVSAKQAPTHIKAACGRAGLEPVTVHDVRHLAAVRLVRLGATLYEVKELLGHRSMRQTLRYAGHDPESAAARAVARLDAHSGSISRTAARENRGR